MLNPLLTGLETTREQLVKQFMLAKGSDRAEILTRIMDLDDEIQKEKSEN